MSGQGTNILLLGDDCRDCRFVSKALCEFEGAVKFNVATTTDVTEAIGLLDRQCYEVVLLEMDLPAGGVESVVRLRRRYPHVPIVIMTSNPDDETVVTAMQSGADDYLVKGRMYKDVMLRSIRYAIERKKETMRVEKVLEEERNRAQNYLDVAGVIILVVDPSQRVRLINKKGCEVLGYSEREVVGKDWCENFVPGRLREQVRTKISGLLKGQCEAFEYFENFVQTRSGGERYIAWHNTVLRNERGAVESVLRSGEDITEKKRAEFELKLLNKELEATIGKLTFSNRELQNFVHVAAHDLKAPLRAIGTLTDWIVTDYGDKLDATGRERLRLLLGRTKRMSRLIDGILQYSGICRAKEKERRVDLNVVVEEVLGELKVPGHVTIEIGDELPTVFCEKIHIWQVFHALLNNAVRFIDKPKGQVEVQCRDKDTFWEFAVSDNGRGIEASHFERIFRIFESLERTDGVTGTGVGLAIVKKIVEMYGGKVRVESEPGRWSTFYFTFPKLPDVVRNEMRTAAAVSA